MEALFLVSVAFIVYTYLFYPLVIFLWGTLFPRRIEKSYQRVPLTVVLAVRNEESNIEARLEDLSAQNYPADLVEIVVVSDASTDRTVELARRFEGDRVKVLELARSAGKSGALNAGVVAATNDVIVFADARQRFGDNVFAELAAVLADERVGGVSGELVIEPRGGSDVGQGVGLYWRYEKLIRRMESASGSVVGATGSIYAIRKGLFVPLPEHTLLDDFVVPMRIVLRGYRVVFERLARAYDISSATAAQEFARKVRTLAGNFQAVAIEKRLLDPFRNPVFFQFVSHKLARLVVPYFCIAALVSSGLVAGAFFRTLFALQLVFYGLGLLNLTVIGRTWIGVFTRVSWTFIVLNAAAVAGFWVFVTGRYRTVWKRA
jgi:biofilm PGA synthesis N-glycosyltransferase PgaC